MRYKRAPGSVLLLLLVLVGLPGQAHAKSSAARLTACATSLVQADRHLAVEGTMTVRNGATRMQMRFELQSRTPAQPTWRTLVAPGFGIWNSADPAVRRYVYQKRVQALAAPAGYRMIVQFRWLDGARQVAQRRQVTRVCEQPDVRPDLTPRRVLVKGAGASRRYQVRLANSGGAAAGPFSVLVTVNGAPLPVGVVAGLGAGRRTQVEIAGPGCAPGSRVVVRVDPDGRVDEGVEADNELVSACPRQPLSAVLDLGAQ